MSSASVRERYRVLTGALFAASLVAAYASWDFYSFGVLKDVNPAMAYTLRPDDPDAFTAAMRQKILKDKVIIPAAADVANAKASLKHSALNRAALRTIGFGAEVERKPDAAREALVLADRISRRDPLVQMWLIESNRRAGMRVQNVPHYAAAMSVEPKLITVLAPGLIDGLQYPGFQQSLVKQMTGSPAWADELTLEFAQRAQLPLAQTFLMSVAKVDPGYRYSRAYATMALRLAASNDSSKALAFLKAVDPKFDAAAFRQAGWNAVSTRSDFGALGWSGVSRPGVNVDFSTPGLAFVSLEPLANAIVTNRAIPVESGQTYRLSLNGASDTVDASGYIDIVAECATPGQRAKLAQFRVSPTTTRTAFETSLSVPPQCGLLNLVLYGRGGDGQFSTEFNLSDLALVKRGPATARASSAL